MYLDEKACLDKKVLIFKSPTVCLFSVLKKHSIGFCYSSIIYRFLLHTKNLGFK